MTENSVVSCPPMLSCRRGESGSDFADKRALQPQSAGLVEKIRHVGWHAAIARGRTNDECVVIRQLIHSATTTA